jgi:hypothetical protein
MEDRDGGIDWREIWCNFPTIGAADRVHLDIAFVRCRADGSEPGRQARSSFAARSCCAVRRSWLTKHLVRGLA